MKLIVFFEDIKSDDSPTKVADQILKLMPGEVVTEVNGSKRQLGFQTETAEQTRRLLSFLTATKAIE